jgi:hypothetical protein
MAAAKWLISNAQSKSTFLPGSNWHSPTAALREPMTTFIDKNDTIMAIIGPQNHHLLEKYPTT